MTPADADDHVSVPAYDDVLHTRGLGAEKFEKLLNKQLNGSRTALKVVSQSFRRIPVYPDQFSDRQRRVRQCYNDMSGAMRNSILQDQSDALLVLFDPLDSVTMPVAGSTQSPPLHVPTDADRCIYSDLSPPPPPPSDVSDFVPHPSFCVLFHSTGVVPGVQVRFCAHLRDVGAVILLVCLHAGALSVPAGADGGVVLIALGVIVVLTLHCA
jgi:hypothetical protein